MTIEGGDADGSAIVTVALQHFSDVVVSLPDGRALEQEPLDILGRPRDPVPLFLVGSSFTVRATTRRLTLPPDFY